MMTNSSRSRRTSVLVAAAFVSLLVLGCKEGATAAGKPPAQGSAVDFKLKTLDGSKTVTPKDYAGQVVVVDFWATWCMPCRVQTQILEPVYQDYKGRGVQFLAANVGENAELIKKFLKEKPSSYPVLMDGDGSVAASLGVYALPTLLVLDKKGKVVHFESNLVDGDTIRQILKKAGA